MLRFSARGPDGLIDGKSPGSTCKLDATQLRALASIVESGPIPATHGVVRWRLRDLAQWLWKEFRVSLDETTVGRVLKELGFRKLMTRPRRPAQNELAIKDFKKVVLYLKYNISFKKSLPPSWRKSAPASRRAGS